MQIDLNFACLRTCVKLLDRLQIQSLDETTTGDDSIHVVSRLFHKYSGLLLRGNIDCQLDTVVRFGSNLSPMRYLISLQHSDNASEAHSVAKVCLFLSPVQCLPFFRRIE
jgi:hypothetical protein